MQIDLFSDTEDLYFWPENYKDEVHQAEVQDLNEVVNVLKQYYCGKRGLVYITSSMHEDLCLNAMNVPDHKLEKRFHHGIIADILVLTTEDVPLLLTLCSISEEGQNKSYAKNTALWLDQNLSLRCDGSFYIRHCIITPGVSCEKDQLMDLLNSIHTRMDTIELPEDFVRMTESKYQSIKRSLIINLASFEIGRASCRERV